MAEVYGVAAGALGLLGVIDASMSIGGKILEYIKDFSDEKNEHGRLRMELTILDAVLPLVKEKLNDPDSAANPAFVAAAKALGVKDGPMKPYEHSLERIRMGLDKMRPPVQKPSCPKQTTLPPPKISQTFGRKFKRIFNSKPKSSSPNLSPSSSSTSLPTEPPPALPQRLTWPSTLNDIHEDLARIERFKTSLMLLLVAGAPAAGYASISISSGVEH